MNLIKNKTLLVSQIVKYVTLFLVSLLFMLLFSLWTTPLYRNWYGCDASFFTMAGRGIVNGWVPYRDFFDLKGPYFFFVEAIGQFIVQGRSGAFVIQVIANFFSLILIMKLSRLFISRKKTVFVMLVFLLGHIATLWGGNTLEEYALPLSLLCLYRLCKDYKTNGSFIISNLTAFLCGLSIGIITFAKVTVSAPICAIVFATCVIYLYNKHFKNLFMFILYVILGFLAGIAPVFIYFGIQGNLSDMIYSVFIFAFKRGIDSDKYGDPTWELKISGCYFAIIFAICQFIPAKETIRSAIRNIAIFIENHTNNQEQSNETENIDVNLVSEKIKKKSPVIYELIFVLLCMALLTSVTLHLGDPFIYYFTTSYPSLLFALIMMLYIYKPLTLFVNWRLDIPFTCFVIFCVSYFASCSASTIDTVIYDRDNVYYQEYTDAALEMGSFIPQADRDKVFSFNIDMQWFEINKILPCNRYQVNLQYFCSLDPRIRESLLEWLDTTPPKWLVVGGDLSTYIPEINDSVMEKYTEIYTNGYGALYLINTETPGHSDN